MEETKAKRNPILSFFINTLNGMAYGLFATLIIGTIISTIGGFFKVDSFMYSLLKTNISTCLMFITGAGIGAGVAISLKLEPLKVVVLASVGEIAAFLSKAISTVDGKATVVENNAFKIGDPLTIYIVVISVVLLMKLVLRKKTPVDILLVPLFSITCATIITMLIRTPLIYVTFGIQYAVNVATTYQPFLMGIVIAVIMGMALTAPISSAAIAAMVFTGEGAGLEIASGAAMIGCCTQMVGFAVQSIRDNSVGTVISVGIGTSMLQFKNIMKKPIIWLPTIITSAILGPISTCLLKAKCMGSAAGMGTSGLVGQIGTIASMGSSVQTWLIIILFEIITPAIIVFLIDLLFRKLKLIKEGDLTI